MRSRRALTCLFSIYLITSACSSDETTQNHSFQIIEEDGIPVALTTGGPKYEGELFTFEEVVRLEQDESNEESILYQASQYLMGEDGNYYVCDRGNVRIAVFNPDGRYERSFGRDGDGPGEFRSPNLLWIRNNNVAVFDSWNRRTSLFRLNGTFLQSFSFLKAGLSISELHPVQEGCMVIIDSGLSYLVPVEDQVITYKATVVTQEGDTLSQVESPPYSMGEMIDVDRRGGIFNLPYFSSTSSVRYYPDKGILVYSTAEPEFKWYDLGGKLISIIRVDMPPPPVTSEDRQAIEKMLDDSIESASDDIRLAVAKVRKKHAIIPEMKSYWTSITVDDSGYYWLSGNPDYSADSMERFRQPCKVLSPDGEYLGDSTLPEVRIYFSRGHVLTFREDADTGEPFFIVYRIIPAVEGLKYP